MFRIVVLPVTLKSLRTKEATYINVNSGNFSITREIGSKVKEKTTPTQEEIKEELEEVLVEK